MRLKIERYSLATYLEVIAGWSTGKYASDVAERLEIPLDVVREVYGCLDA